jgi:transposase-like protein
VTEEGAAGTGAGRGADPSFGLREGRSWRPGLWQQPQRDERQDTSDGRGEIAIDVPRDRAGTFEPVIVAKGQTRFEGFDEKIISLYGRGMTVREIQGHLAELYGTEVSPDLISKVTDAILEEVRDWQSRPLEAVYPVIFFDALRVKSVMREWSRTRPFTSCWA